MLWCLNQRIWTIGPSVWLYGAWIVHGEANFKPLQKKTLTYRVQLHICILTRPRRFGLSKQTRPSVATDLLAIKIDDIGSNPVARVRPTDGGYKRRGCRNMESQLMKLWKALGPKRNN